MLKIPKKVVDRIAATLKPYQAVIEDIIARDVSEADTVTVVKDILADVFGYSKYTELTSEQQIRGTFCDLAVKIDLKTKFLIEVKSAGSDLNDSHLRQAVNYGVHEGIEWIVLTNASDWKLYKVSFAQPIEYEEVSCFSLRTASAKDEDVLQRMFLLCREAISLDAMGMFHQNAMLLNKYTIGQVVLSSPIISAIRREMRRLFPELKVDADTIDGLLVDEIIKRDVLDGEKAKDAQGRIRKSEQRLARVAAKKEKVSDQIDGAIQTDNSPVGDDVDPDETTAGASA